MQASGNESVTWVHYFIWPVALHNFIDHFSHCAQPHSVICMYRAREISQTWDISQKIQPSLLSLHCLGRHLQHFNDRNSILMTWIDVYIITLIIIGFQMQIFLSLCLLLVYCCNVLGNSAKSSSKTQLFLLLKNIILFHEYSTDCFAEDFFLYNHINKIDLCLLSAVCKQ